MKRRDLPKFNRPVRVTAFSFSVRHELVSCRSRPMNRLQHPLWSDPNVQRAKPGSTRLRMEACEPNFLSRAWPSEIAPCTSGSGALGGCSPRSSVAANVGPGSLRSGDARPTPTATELRGEQSKLCGRKEKRGTDGANRSMETADPRKAWGHTTLCP